MPIIELPDLDNIPTAGEPIDEPIVEGVISECHALPEEADSIGYTWPVKNPFFNITVDVLWPEKAKGRKLTFKRFRTEKSLPFLKRFLKAVGVESRGFATEKVLGKKIRLALTIEDKENGGKRNEVQAEYPACRI